MRVAVTGGCGFIGSHVVDHLVAGRHDVLVDRQARAMANPAAEYLPADLFDAAALDAALPGSRRGLPPGRHGRRQRGRRRSGHAVRLNVEGVAPGPRRRPPPGCGRVRAGQHGLGLRRDRRARRADRGRAGRPGPGRATCTCPRSSPPRCSCTATGRCTGRNSPSCATASRTGPGCGTRWWWPGSSGPPWTASRSPSPGTGEQQRNYVYVEDLADAHVRALAPAAANQTLALEGGTPVSVREIADTVCSLVAPGAGPARAGPRRRLRGRGHLQPAGQGAARLVAGDPVRRGRPQVPGLAQRAAAEPVLGCEHGDGLGRGLVTTVTTAERPAGRDGSAGAAAVRVDRHGPRQLAEACAASLEAVRLVDADPGRDAAAGPGRRLGRRGGIPGDARGARPVSTRSISPRCAREPAGPAGRRGGPAADRPAAAASTSSRTRPTWSSRCSRPARRPSAGSPTRYPAMSHVVFCTDVTPHRLWVHPNVDLYLVTLRGRGGRGARFQPEARVLVVPAAGAAGVLPAAPQEEARAALGVPAGGALRPADVGRLGPRAGGRLRPRRWATRACTCWPWPAATPGSSAGCARSAARQPRVRAFGFTDRHPGPDGRLRPGHHQLRRHLHGGQDGRAAAAAARRGPRSRPGQPPARA